MKKKGFNSSYGAKGKVNHTGVVEELKDPYDALIADQKGASITILVCLTRVLISHVPMERVVQH